MARNGYNRSFEPQCRDNGIGECSSFGHVFENNASEVTNKLKEVLTKTHNRVKLVIHTRDAKSSDTTRAEVTFCDPSKAIEENRNNVGVERMNVEKGEGLPIMMANRLNLFKLESITFYSTLWDF